MMTANSPPSPNSSNRVVPISTGVNMDENDCMEKGEALQDTAQLTGQGDDSQRMGKKRLALLCSLVLVAAVVGTSVGVMSSDKTYEYPRSLKPDDATTRTEAIAGATGTTLIPFIEFTLCQDNEDCAEGSYCKHEDGKCEVQGVCSDVPTLCTAIYLPVCGCDEKTYASKCTAAGKGISVLYTGECIPKSCDRDENCEGEDAFCMFTQGECGGVGECAVKPEICTADYSPVCGCNNVTYSNACQAQSVGISIVSEGECCTSNDDCEGDLFCKSFDGDCGGLGGCVVKPDACTEEYAPVCGCDGITYGNPCNAEAAGASIASQGECCNTNDDCRDEFFCKFPEGDCGTTGVTGGCTKSGEMPCTLEWDPFCGCDGVTTFGNACAADAAGMSILSQGECPEPPTATGTRARTDPVTFSCSDCGADECVLKFGPGDCGLSLSGDCVAKPTYCSRMENPVCGCDGVIYANECIALKDGGVSVGEEALCSP